MYADFCKSLQSALHAGTNFATVEYATKVATAAKYKTVCVTKVVTANVQLFDSVKNNPFVKAVERSVERSTGEKPEFVVSENWFNHTEECYSVVSHPKGEKYLYAIYNSAKSTYYVDGVEATFAEVLAMMTPSAAKAASGKATYNATNDVTHDVVVRTIKLSNIHYIKTGGHILIPVA